MSKRILLVEDEAKLREQLVEILERHDYRSIRPRMVWKVCT